jgi:hypothetical protein
MRIRGRNNPLEAIARTRNRTNLNMFRALSKQKAFGPFFYAECTVTGTVYLDMLGEFLRTLLEEQGPDDIMFQQDGIP